MNIKDVETANIRLITLDHANGWNVVETAEYILYVQNGRKRMKIGDGVYVHGYVDEIRKDTVIIRNNGGYFGTVKNEIVVPFAELATNLQQSCNQLATDCISRQAAIDVIKRLHDVAWNNWHETNISPNTVIEALRELPSAQSEPSQAARDIATILENEKDMRVIKKNAESESCVDTISRKAAIDALFELYEYQRDIDPTEAADLVRQGIYLAEKKIEQLPSAQPELIRCKDCKYMTEHYNTDGNVPYWTCSEWDSGTDYDGFCHYAERKNNV